MARDRGTIRGTATPSRGRSREDGIATSKQRGAMAEPWWSQRFVDDARLLRARHPHATRPALRPLRAGAVLRGATPACSSPRCRGRAATPYLVSIRSAHTNRRRVGSAAGRPASQGRLRRPTARRRGATRARSDAARSAGIALFPKTWSQLDCRCNCPDWENPCKHLAAVLYVFADQLDDDPWLLFTWRGRSRDQLLEHLSCLTAASDNHGLPTWWPLVPGHAGLDRIRWRPPSDVTAPSPAHSVLARLQPLEATYADAPLIDHILSAYPVLTATEDAGPETA